MDYSQFKSLCQQMGFNVVEEYKDEVVYAENTVGDQIWYRDFVTDSGEHVHEVNFESDTYGVDHGYEHMDPQKMVHDGDCLVLQNVSGTRPSEGFGVAGFVGDIRFSVQKTVVREEH